MDGKLCIVDTSLSRYMPKYIKQMSKINDFTYGCKSCISAMLLQKYLNTCRLSQLDKIDKLYISSTSTRLLLRYMINFIDHKSQMFPNNSHIHLRA